jgi:hypothetical protein
MGMMGGEGHPRRRGGRMGRNGGKVLFGHG